MPPLSLSTRNSTCVTDVGTIRWPPNGSEIEPDTYGCNGKSEIQSREVATSRDIGRFLREKVLAFLKSAREIARRLLVSVAQIHRVSRAGSRRTRVALMERYARATMTQCTQTPFPGSELLDPNPFVPSPIKPKDTPGVGDKRALPFDAVCNQCLPCHETRPATELRPSIASRADVSARRGRTRSGRRVSARGSRPPAKAGSTPTSTSACEQPSGATSFSGAPPSDIFSISFAFFRCCLAARFASFSRKKAARARFSRGGASMCSCVARRCGRAGRVPFARAALVLYVLVKSSGERPTGAPEVARRIKNLSFCAGPKNVHQPRALAPLLSQSVSDRNSVRLHRYSRSVSTRNSTSGLSSREICMREIARDCLKSVATRDGIWRSREICMREIARDVRLNSAATSCQVNSEPLVGGLMVQVK